MKFATVATTVVMMILGLTVPAQAENPAHLKQLLEPKTALGVTLVVLS